MQLEDLLPVTEWVALEKEIHRRSGLEASIFNPAGIRITDNKIWVNRLCPAIKATDKGQSFICAVAHMNLAAQARQSGQPVIEECDAGLLKIVVPVFAAEEFIGAFGACGLLRATGEVDEFMIGKTTGISEDSIAGLSQDIGRIADDAAETLAQEIMEEIGRRIKAHARG